eukprot:UN27309
MSNNEDIFKSDVSKILEDSFGELAQKCDLNVGNPEITMVKYHFDEISVTEVQANCQEYNLDILYIWIISVVTICLIISVWCYCAHRQKKTQFQLPPELLYESGEIQLAKKTRIKTFGHFDRKLGI